MFIVCTAIDIIRR